MSMAFKETKYLRLVDGSIWGLCTIDLFGLGMDIPDVMLVIQWNLRGSALIFAEREFFNNERKKKEEQKKLKGKKRKRSSLNAQGKHLAAILCKTDRAPRALVINAGATNPEGADDSTDMDLQGEEESTVHRQEKQPQAGWGKKLKKAKEELNIGIDFLINADVRGVGCRQTVFDVYFENQDADSDHTNCDPSNPTSVATSTTQTISVNTNSKSLNHQKYPNAPNSITIP
ncbi:hypothetical protein SERLADRAFT_434282 [Serpula lacrymans var. lacrymans S7.9]|uniref:Helicase C-terminal domain-containing protein n=1 Tax=Serpula lacrymans var. lacrymans (strain S7.9) TaxID=578457 RepID=F8NKA9_SERL9|nr:uncharacterized protein SERLADRAFT_434282 [Serpula lacrymans var. lacrymans S7.9]EGO28375.1 hypothetical protein SERLADRAFT_434282 [Serpula lacrymans var. lacrymans S7.9]